MTSGGVVFAQTAPLPESAAMPAMAVEVKPASRKMQARRFVIKLRFGDVQDTGAALYLDRDAQASRCSRLSSRRLNFLQAALEKSALAAIGDQGQCPFIALRRFCCGSDSAQQIGTGGMQQVVVVEITACNERVNELERGRGAIHHRDRDRPVQRHNRRGLYPLDHIVNSY